MTVDKDRVVYLHYTLKNEKGDILDSSAESEPLAYIHGNGHLIQGLEESLSGKEPKSSMQVVVPPEKGYGEYIENMTSVHPRDKFSDPDEIQLGMQVHAETEKGVVVLTVTDLDENEVTLDANHPLAGETLHFDVTIIDVREASKEELEHGHVH